jgi:taurine dioxygenase
MAVRTVEIVPLGPVLGAEVKGVDLRKPVPPELATAIDRALNEHIVLVFRGQDPLTEAEQIAFTAGLGPIEVRAATPGAAQRPYSRLVSNVNLEGYQMKPSEYHATEMYFHHDTCFQPTPQKALLLNALEVPAKGGNTVFADMYRVYDALPADIKDRIAGLRALHVFIFTKTERADISKGYDNMLHATHPVAIRHPATGRKVLYVNRLMTIRIEGLPERESDELLETLFAVGERPEFHYEHVWQAGDLILWDNLASMHARTDMVADEPRVMRHTSLKGFAVPAA